jgi:hypothetical protein
MLQWLELLFEEIKQSLSRLGIALEMLIEDLKDYLIQNFLLLMQLLIDALNFLEIFIYDS